VIKVKLPHDKFRELKDKKEKLDTYDDKLKKAGFDAVGNINMGMIDYFIIGVVKRSLDFSRWFYNPTKLPKRIKEILIATIPARLT